MLAGWTHWRATRLIRFSIASSSVMSTWNQQTTGRGETYFLHHLLTAIVAALCTTCSAIPSGEQHCYTRCQLWYSCKNVVSEWLLPIVSEQLLYMVSNPELGPTNFSSLFEFPHIWYHHMFCCVYHVSCPGNFLSDEHGPRFV